MKKSKKVRQEKLKRISKISDFVRSLSPEHRMIVEQIREIIFRISPDIEESIKWNMPCYSVSGDVCYIASFKEHINFGFYKGAMIADPKKLLVGSGKNLRHIKILEKEDVHIRTFTQLIKQAVKLDKD